MISFIVIISFNCNQSVRQPVSKDSTFIFSNFQDVSVINASSSSVKFNIVINDIFPLSNKQILNCIEELSKKKMLSLEEASWYFVSNTTRHTNSIYTDFNLYTSPDIFINSLASAMCGERAKVLSNIWCLQGFKTRLVLLDSTHVVAEVFSDEKWKMYDPDYGTFYCNEFGEVLSVEEIHENLDYIKCPKRFCKENNFANSKLRFFNDHDVESYINSRFKYINNHGEKINKTNIEFEIPSHSTLDFYFKNKSLEGLLLNLLEKSMGSLYLAFLPLKVEGKLVYNLIAEDTVIDITDDYFKENFLMEKMDVLSASEGTKIFYLTNSLFKFLESENIFKIYTNNDLEIKTTNQINRLTNSEIKKIRRINKRIYVSKDLDYRDL